MEGKTKTLGEKKKPPKKDDTKNRRSRSQILMGRDHDLFLQRLAQCGAIRNLCKRQGARQWKQSGKQGESRQRGTWTEQE